MVGTPDFMKKNTKPSGASSSNIPQATPVGAVGAINVERRKAKRETTNQDLIDLMNKGLVVPQHLCAPQVDVG